MRKQAKIGGPQAAENPHATVADIHKNLMATYSKTKFYAVTEEAWREAADALATQIIRNAE